MNRLSHIPDRLLHCHYLISQSCTIFGLTITVFDIIKGLPIVFGLFGSLFAMLAGFYSYKIKKLQLTRLEDDQE